MKILTHSGTDLSRFKTMNRADNYCEVSSPEDAAEAFAFAASNLLKPFVLGGGSNVFFKNRRIKSLIIKNALPPLIEDLGAGRIKASSSATMMAFLKFALERGLDAPYFLASAPCQIGGAIAMNAGTGPAEARYVSDYIESVTFAKGASIATKTKAEINFSHRHSEFTDAPDVFIVSAIFALPRKTYAENPIKARLLWAKKNQDLRSNNCGSLCNAYNAYIMKFARAVFSNMPAGLSSKKLNWAVNKSQNPFWLNLFLNFLKFFHGIFFKKLKFEIRIVD